MIKNIIFDLGNVILKDKPSTILDNLEIEDSERETIKKYFFNNWRELDLGNTTLEEHLKSCNIPIDLTDDIKEKLTNYYRYREFNLEVVELMKMLKNNNYNIYILSDNNKEAYHYLRYLPLLKDVDGWIMSCEYHITKPNKKIYRILFEKYKLDPKESFFIDDKEINIEAGKILGMQGHILNFEKYGISELLKALRENNVKC